MSINNEKKRQTLEKKRISKVSFELGIPEDIIEKSLEIMFGYIKQNMEKADLKQQDLLSEEEFNKQVPTIKIPHLGYLVPNYKLYTVIKKRQINK